MEMATHPHHADRPTVQVRVVGDDAGGPLLPMVVEALVAGMVSFLSMEMIASPWIYASSPVQIQPPDSFLEVDQLKMCAM